MKVKIYRTTTDFGELQESIVFLYGDSPAEEDNSEWNLEYVEQSPVFEIPQELFERYKKKAEELSAIEDEIKALEPEIK